MYTYRVFSIDFRMTGWQGVGEEQQGKTPCHFGCSLWKQPPHIRWLDVRRLFSQAILVEGIPWYQMYCEDVSSVGTRLVFSASASLCSKFLTWSRLVEIHSFTCCVTSLLSVRSLLIFKAKGTVFAIVDRASLQHSALLWQSARREYFDNNWTYGKTSLLTLWDPATDQRQTSPFNLQL